jgi:hypothetical protein
VTPLQLQAADIRTLLDDESPPAKKPKANTPIKGKTSVTKSSKDHKAKHPVQKEKDKPSREQKAGQLRTLPGNASCSNPPGRVRATPVSRQPAAVFGRQAKPKARPKPGTKYTSDDSREPRASSPSSAGDSAFMSEPEDAAGSEPEGSGPDEPTDANG